jgi:DNA-binding Xre family transcriptional regulator
MENNLRILVAQKEQRERRTISQRELARETGVPIYTIGTLYGGEWKRIERDSILALCLYLDCSPGELFTIEQ